MLLNFNVSPSNKINLTLEGKSEFASGADPTKLMKSNVAPFLFPEILPEPPVISKSYIPCLTSPFSPTATSPVT